jgi:pre-mRNA-processing factor 19
MLIISSPLASLSSTRKSKLKRKPSGYVQAGEIGGFGQSKLIPSMHSTKQPGVTSLDVSSDGSLLLTGGNDKQVQIYDNANDKILATLKGHTKGITHVSFAIPTIGLEFGNSSTTASAPTFAISASLDSSVRVWKADETAQSFTLAHTINEYKSPVTGISVHPSAEFFAAAHKNGSWALYDLTTGSRLLEGSAKQELTSLDIHPDGILMSLGTSSGAILIIDIRSGQESATFQAESSTSVTSLSFSENGYYLASATLSQVEVWDLRKLSKAGTIAVEGDGKTKVAIRFDPSAQFLAVVGTDVRIYANKTWQLLWSDDASNTAEVSDVKWNYTTGDLITASLDRTVRAFAPKAAEQSPSTIETA